MNCSLVAWTVLCACVCISLAETECGSFDAISNTTIATSNLCESVLGKPFCVNVDPENATRFECRECDQNCDCPIHKYCVKKLGEARGTCRQLEEAKWDTPCNLFDPTTIPHGFDENQRFPKLGVNDKLVCGLPVFDNVTSKFLFYEWLAFCGEGKCAECASLGSYRDQFQEFEGMTQPSSLLCPQRECIGQKLQVPSYAVPAKEIFNIKIPKETEGVTGAILFFVIAIWLIQVLMCFCWFRRARSTPKYKKVAL